MKGKRIIFAAALSLAAVPQARPAGDPSFTLRVHGAFLKSTAGDDAGSDTGFVNRVDAGGGVGVGVEYRISERMGLEFSALTAGLQIDGRLSGGAGAVQSFELSVVPLTVGVPIHIPTGGRADLFVGPTFSLVHYLDLEMRIGTGGAGTRIDVDSDPAPGVEVGIDIPFERGKWAFSAGLRYLRTRAGDVAVDPVIATFGFAYRF